MEPKKSVCSLVTDRPLSVEKIRLLLAAAVAAAAERGVLTVTVPGMNEGGGGGRGSLARSS